MLLLRVVKPVCVNVFMSYPGMNQQGVKERTLLTRCVSQVISGHGIDQKMELMKAKLHCTLREIRIGVGVGASFGHRM
jgi:hypothetical protein